MEEGSLDLWDKLQSSEQVGEECSRQREQHGQRYGAERAGEAGRRSWRGKNKERREEGEIGKEDRKKGRGGRKMEEEVGRMSGKEGGKKRRRNGGGTGPDVSQLCPYAIGYEGEL